jgi:hypothetical protein
MTRSPILHMPARASSIDTSENEQHSAGAKGSGCTSRTEFLGGDNGAANERSSAGHRRHEQREQSCTQSQGNATQEQVSSLVLGARKGKPEGRASRDETLTGAELRAGDSQNVCVWTVFGHQTRSEACSHIWYKKSISGCAKCVVGRCGYSVPLSVSTMTRAADRSKAAFTALEAMASLTEI